MNYFASVLERTFLSRVYIHFLYFLCIKCCLGISQVLMYGACAKGHVLSGILGLDDPFDDILLIAKDAWS